MGVAMLERLGRLDDAARVCSRRARRGAARRRDAARRARSPGRRASGACSTPPPRSPASASSSTTRDRRRWSSRRWSGRLASSPSGWIVADGRLDLAPLMRSMLDERLQGREAAEAFHGTLIAGLAEWIGAAARERGIRRIALGGGCLMNRVLAEGLIGVARARRVSIRRCRARRPPTTAACRSDRPRSPMPGPGPAAIGWRM